MSELRDRSDSLLVRARSLVCALPLTDVVEIMRPLRVEHLASGRSVVLGVALIRGAPVPVVDAGALLGRNEPAFFTRFVTLRVRARRVALAVEAVIGVRNIAGLGKLPPLLAAANRNLLSEIGTLDAELLVVLRAAHVLPADVWTVLEPDGDPA